jgi:hypothetical protein
VKILSVSLLFFASALAEAQVDTARAATRLNPVVIEAAPSNYLLLASHIAASNRPIRDALEALQKLKPSMLYDRDRCKNDLVENVWINGRRVLFMASKVPVFGRRSASVGLHTARRGKEPPAVDSVLASIDAEHVQDIRLVNCWDTYTSGVGEKNALHVTLKPGVEWDVKRGSFRSPSH